MHNNDEINLIDRTYDVRLPSGHVTQINCFDFNISSVCAQADPKFDKYVQLEDSSWIKFRSITLIGKSEANQ